MCLLTKSGGQHTPGLWTRQVKWMNAKTLPVLHLGLPLPGKSVLPVPSPVPQQAFPWPPALPSAALCPQHCCDLSTGCWGCFWAKSCQHHLLSALVPLDPSAHLARGVLLNSLSKAGNGCQKCLLRVALILKCHKPQAACNEWQTCHWFWVVENKRQCLGRVLGQGVRPLWTHPGLCGSVSAWGWSCAAHQLSQGGCRVEWRLLLSLNLPAVSLFEASQREVKGLWGEDLQGMETLCWWLANKCSSITASPTPLTFWPQCLCEQGLSCCEFEGLCLTQFLCSEQTLTAFRTSLI